MRDFGGSGLGCLGLPLDALGDGGLLLVLRDVQRLRVPCTRGGGEGSELKKRGCFSNKPALDMGGHGGGIGRYLRRPGGGGGYSPVLLRGPGGGGV